MLKILIKKQLYQYFSGFFINQKTHKAKSKKSLYGMIALFIFVIIVCQFSFFGMSMLLTPLFGTGYEWLFYAVFGMLSIVLGVFASCFSASAYLYKAKDNDLLLSMPIKPSDILLSRIISLYLIGLIYSSWVWLPIILNGWIQGNISVLIAIFDILLLFIIGLIVTSLACVVGYIVSVISLKFKNRSYITVVVSLIAMGAYYFLMFRLENIMTNLVTNAATTSKNFKIWLNVLYQLGIAANGDVLGFVVFTLISMALFGIVLVVLSRSFIKIVTKNDVGRVKNTKIKYEKNNGYKKALFKKELKRFTSSSLYIMNTGLGAVFVLVAAVVAILKKSELDSVLLMIKTEPAIGWIIDFLPIALIVGLLMIINIDCISCPSISLEGKTLWQLKALPVNAYDIFEAKEKLHVVINGIPMFIASIIICFCLGFDFSTSLLIVVVLLLSIDINAWVGLVIGLLRPDFTWTSETQPIKQSLNILLDMLFSLIYVVAIGGIYYLLKDILDINTYLSIVVIFDATAIIMLRKWFRTKGAIKFQEL